MVEVQTTARRAGSPRGRRWLVAVSLAVGLLGAIAIAAGSSPPERTFAAISGPAQSLTSVVVPFIGVLMVRDLPRPLRPAAALTTIARAVGLALLIAALGVLICATVTALSPSTASGGTWSNAGMVVLGSLLVQSVAQLVGTGFGLLLGRPVLAGPATIVFPLGLWALFGAITVLQPAQAWLTPFPSVQNLLAGDMSPLRWAQWLTVLAIWGIGLNAAGLARASRR